MTKVEEIKRRVPISAVIGETLALRRDGRELVALCPFHAERTPSFTVNDAKSFFHCFGCGAHGDVFDWLEQTRGMTLPEAAQHLACDGPRPNPKRVDPMPPPVAEHDDDKWRRDAARRIWSEAVPAAGTAAERYLLGRALMLPSDAPIRFHPACPRGADRHPAMMALMTDPITAAPCGVHRTFLQPDGGGKAPGNKTKMMLGTAGVIRLVPDAEVTVGLGLAEGIETSLAVMQRTGWRPVWAATSAGAIARFPVLAGVEALTIFADADGPGVTAARTCCQRWADAGREPRLLAPPMGDWDDTLHPAEVAA
jgi:hypothetical protein